MKISKKAEYALRAVLAMSRSATGTIFSIQSLAEEERIPLKFLEQILLILRKGGIMHSRRGAGGGYQLVRPASRITVGEILELVDGPIELLPDGNSLSPGLTSAFQELQGEMQAWLTKMTLADVMQREQLRGAVSFDI
ncbi:RrF2 family transcriptional regulator [Verrucomicrobium spinosum]|uniref:RrF2 family transcriptional regulator n=1 Tax=Verrucomicrobium spinosum TaxID=2736 RepID=UPI0001746312|nr:Rrf2 family transcriptional regulator [Verrucomicrobium spinosum]